MTCYIIDDEPLALDVLKSHIGNFGGLELKGSFQNPVTAFQKIHQEPVDLLFLDIQMPELTGIELMKSLKQPPLVIFTTAYRDFAITGYELDVVDYLLKPITFERFLKAMSKIFRYKPGNSNHSEQEDNKSLLIQSSKKTFQIPIENILFVESQRNKIKIVTMTETLEFYETLSVMEDVLANKGFLRVHRSFIVAMDKITSWSANEVTILKDSIPIGRSFASEVKKKLNDKGNRYRNHSL